MGISKNITQSQNKWLLIYGLTLTFKKTSFYIYVNTITVDWPNK